MTSAMIKLPPRDPIALPIFSRISCWLDNTKKKRMPNMYSGRVMCSFFMELNMEGRWICVITVPSSSESESATLPISLTRKNSKTKSS